MSDILCNEINLYINIYGMGCPTCGLEVVTINCKYRSDNSIIKYNELLNFIENETQQYMKDCHRLRLEKIYSSNEDYIAEIHVDDV